jgi:hypothetical protein
MERSFAARHCPGTIGCAARAGQGSLQTEVFLISMSSSSRVVGT